MDAKATKEEETGQRSVEHGSSKRSALCNLQERYPGQIFDGGIKKTTVAKTILEEGEPQIAENGEDSHASEPHFETVKVVSIHRRRPAKEKIVHKRETKASSNAVLLYKVSRICK